MGRNCGKKRERVWKRIPQEKAEITSSDSTLYQKLTQWRKEFRQEGMGGYREKKIRERVWERIPREKADLASSDPTLHQKLAQRREQIKRKETRGAIKKI